MTMRPTFDSRATASMAVSTSLASCMADEDNRTPNDGAVASITAARISGIPSVHHHQHLADTWRDLFERLSGIVRPSALAVLRLITRSNLAGACNDLRKARLATTPLSTGSARLTNTMGIVRVMVKCGAMAAPGGGCVGGLPAMSSIVMRLPSAVVERPPA